MSSTFVETTASRVDVQAPSYRMSIVLGAAFLAVAALLMAQPGPGTPAGYVDEAVPQIVTLQGP